MYPPWEISAIISDIRQMAKQMHIKFSHTPQTCNRIAHWVASKAMQGSLDASWVSYRPEELVVLLRADSM